MGTHLQQGTFTLREGQTTDALVSEIWSLGGYVRFSESSPNTIDVVAPSGIFPLIRAKLSPTGGIPQSQEPAGNVPAGQT